jgi:hypothetical protein
VRTILPTTATNATGNKAKETGKDEDFILRVENGEIIVQAVLNEIEIYRKPAC